MYQKIGHPQNMKNMNTSLMNLSSGAVAEEKVNLTVLKMYDWILRKIGSKKHYSDYIKISMKQVEMNIDEEKPSLVQGI